MSPQDNKRGKKKDGGLHGTKPMIVRISTDLDVIVIGH